MKKEIKTILKSSAIIIIAYFILIIFGIDFFTKIILKKVLFTPYNTTGIIMTIVFICGGHMTKKQGHYIKEAVMILSGTISICSLACNISKWLNIDLLQLLWIKILKPPAITFFTILFWLVIVIVGIIILFLIGIILYEFIYFLKQKKKNRSNTNEKEMSLEVTNITDNIQDDASSDITNVSKESEQNKASQLTERESKIIKNICPYCGGQLIEKTNGKTKQKFIGCTNYWDKGCTFNLSVKEHSDILNKNK